MTTAAAEELKQKGNKAFSEKDYQNAVNYFSQAIEAEPSHVIYSNRSAAYCSMKDYENAVKDAEKAIEICPNWSKGYGRLGAAYYGLNDLEKAEKAYEKGLEVEPESAALKKGLEDVRAKQSTSGFDKLFSGDFLGKLASSPKTSKFMSQPDFIQKMRDLQANPSLLNQYIQDPRVMEAFGVLMGIDFSSMAQMEEERRRDEEFKARKVKEENERMKKEAEAVTPSQEEKKLGTAAYKEKKFEQALVHYTKAWELEKVDITILTNKAAVYFEMGKLYDCVKECEAAIEVGRDLKADFKNIAKAYARIGKL
jgi:stress-induced-phosphoprotein 1